MYFDWTFIVLVIPALLVATIASARVKIVFRTYSEVGNMRNITGGQAARTLLDRNGLNHIRVEGVVGELTDHYDPEHGVIRLSQPVYNQATISAVGVACHEAGHAIQHANDYTPLKIRNAIIPVTNFGSRLAVPLVIVGLLLSSVSQYFILVAYLGILGFVLSVVFQLVTLPTEYDASRRAMACIEEFGLLNEEEQAGAKKVLSAAAMTYLAALAVSLAQLLRLLLIVAGNNRRN